MAHTPGPWRIDEKTGVVIADHPTGHDGADNLEYYGGHLVCESVQWEGNRRIIAAAPDLLSAAKAALFALKIVNSREPGTNEQGAIDILEEVIAKSTGEK